MSDALKVSSDVFFYKLGEQADRKSRAIQQLGAQARLRPQDRHRHPAARRRAWCPTASGATRRFTKYEQCAEKNHLSTQTRRRAVQVRRRRARRGRRATTSTSPSARAICRPRRCRSRSPTPRWPTTARSSSRTSARRSRTATASRSRSCRSSRGSKIKIDPQDRAVVLDGLHRAASEDGGTSADVFKGFPYEYKIYGKTGTVERQPNPDQAWYACFVKDGGKPIVVVVTVETRRLRCGNCGTRSAPDPLAVVRCEGPRVQSRLRPEQLSAQSDPTRLRAAAPAGAAGMASAPGSAAAARDARAGRRAR